MSTPLFSHKVAAIFVKVDDFCNEFELEFKKHSLPCAEGIKKRNRKSSLSDSEIITILVAFHGGQFRNFKHFYMGYVCVHLKDCFPSLVSYNRFIELSHRCAIVFMMFLHYCFAGANVQALVLLMLPYCGYVTTKGLNAGKVFKGMAKVGKSTVG